MLMEHLPHASQGQPPSYAESSSYRSKDYYDKAFPVGHSKGAKHGNSNPFSDPPPAYSASADVDIPDDALALLSRYDTVFLVDDSLSMKQVDKSGILLRGRSKSRWELARDATARYGKIAGHYDADGVDLHFLNSRLEDRRMKNTNLKTEEEIADLFENTRPHGPTHIGSRLKEISVDYLAQVEKCRERNQQLPKPRNYIIITDGAPTAPDDVTNFLARTAKLLARLKCDPTQLGFQFVQIGNDKEATEFLTYLDNDKGFERDIVDTVKNKDTHNMKSKLRGLFGMDDGAILCRKLLLGGISRFHDRKGDVPTQRR